MQFRMSPLRTHRWLLLLVALLFAVGHAHQAFGRFELHHHGAEIAEHHDHDAGEQSQHDGDGKKDAEHMLEHDAVVGLVPAAIIPMIIALNSVALVDMSAEAMPEAPVAGIDHPPQIVG